MADNPATDPRRPPGDDPTVVDATVPAAPAALLAKPQRIGPYRVLELLGAGGQGEIWLAQDAYGNKVAIKLLGAGHLQNSRMLKRFQHEAQTLKMLQHHGICRIFGVEEHEGKPYMVMEYVEGVSLSHLMRFISHSASTFHAGPAGDTSTELKTIMAEMSRLKASQGGSMEEMVVLPSQRRTFPLQQSLAIVEKVCDAVQYANDRGVLHRDIKPANIIIRPDGEPVLLDFGLARWEREQEMLTAAGEVFGTIDYMSPEQATSSHDVDERADVYSVGVILYELLTGTRFASTTGNVLEDLKRLSDYEPLPPRRLNRHVEADLQAVVLKAACSERGRRYRCAGALAADLRRYREGMPVMARPPSRLYRLTKLMRRHRAAVGLAAGVLLLVGGLGGYLTWDYYRTWGRWVRVLQEDFAGGTLDTTRYEIVPRSGLAYQPWPVDSAGLHMLGGDWCWLRNVSVAGDVRLDLRLSYQGTPDGVEMVVNGDQRPAEQWWHVPAGYSAQVGGYSGTIDLVCINRQSGLPRLFSGAPTACRAGPVLDVSLQRRGSRVELYVNGRLACADRDPLAAYRGRSAGRIGFHSYAMSASVRRIAVYRMSLPQRASPVLAGEALRDMGHYRDAFDAYLRVAADYRGTPLEEQALFGAFLAAQQLPDPAGPALADSAAALLRQGFPRSVYRQAVAEHELSGQWRRRHFAQVLQALPALCAQYPTTRLAVDLNQSQVSLAPVQELFPWVAATAGPSVISALGQSPATFDLLAEARPIGVDCKLCGLSDIKALRRMHLTWLRAEHNTIADLSPLAGQPLAYLGIDNNRVASIAALKGAPLRRLDANENRIEDLGPLAGAALEVALLQNNRISDLSPLQGAPLSVLHLDFNRVSDLGPLRGMPLRQLTLVGNPVADLSPLAGMALEALTLASSLVSDISMLQGMPLSRLYIGSCGVHNLEAVRGLPLQDFSCTGDSISDLSPLAGMRLRQLDLSYNRVSSLAPLAGMPLELLVLLRNHVTDLRPLAGTPLINLNCQDNPLASLDPYVASPPPRLFGFWCPSLSDAEYDRAIAAWSRNPALAGHVIWARAFKALKHSRPADLRSLASSFGGRRYLFLPVLLTFAAADSLARAAGGTLVTLTSREELDFAMGLRPTTLDVWTDLRIDSSDALAWSTGESTQFIRTQAGTSSDRHWVYTDGFNSWPATSEAGVVIEWLR